MLNLLFQHCVSSPVESVAVAGLFYGLTGGSAVNGGVGNGIVYSFNISNNSFQLLATMLDTASQPLGSLIQGVNSELMFAVTSSDNTTTGSGAFISIATSGVVTVLHQFQSAVDGAKSLGQLAQSTTGVIYGCSMSGGSNNQGTVWSFTPTSASSASSTAGGFLLLVSLSSSNAVPTYISLVNNQLFVVTVGSSTSSSCGSIIVISSSSGSILQQAASCSISGVAFGPLLLASDGE